MTFTLRDEPWGTFPLGSLKNDNSIMLKYGFGPIVCAQDFQNLKISGLRHPLPLKGSLTSPSGQGLQYIYDLPMTNSSLQTLVEGGGDSKKVLEEFYWADAIENPYRHHRANKKKIEGENEVGRADGLLSFINSAIGLFDELRLSAEYRAGRRVPDSDGFKFLHPEPERFKKGNFEFLPLGWGDTAKLVLRNSNEPRFDLIIRVAMDFGEELRQLAQAPRKVLRRKRKKTPLARVQQLDPACLAWLVRQPGRRPTEKAGASQEIYSIVREEFFNTLENQVFKKFILLCEKHSQNYLEKYDNPKFSASDRYKLVKRFWFNCKQSLEEPVFEKISELNHMPQPNFVLQFDPTYSKIWQFFLALIHRENEIEHSWLWQGRLWADIVRLFLSTTVQNLTNSKEIDCEVHLNNQLFVRHNTHFGQRLQNGGWPRNIELRFGSNHGVMVDCFDLVELQNSQLPNDTKQLGIGSGADFLIHFTPIGGAIEQNLLLCVWGIHSIEENGNDELLRSQSQRAAQALARLKNQYRYSSLLRGFILRSDIGSKSSKDIPIGSYNGISVEGLSLPGDPDEWRGSMVSDASQYIAECALTSLEGQ